MGTVQVHIHAVFTTWKQYSEPMVSRAELLVSRQRWAEQDQWWAEQNQWWAEQNECWAEQNQWWADQNQWCAEQNQCWAKQNQWWAEQNQWCVYHTSLLLFTCRLFKVSHLYFFCTVDNGFFWRRHTLTINLYILSAKQGDLTTLAGNIYKMFTQLLVIACIMVTKYIFALLLYAYTYYKINYFIVSSL